MKMNEGLTNKMFVSFPNTHSCCMPQLANVSGSKTTIS